MEMQQVRYFLALSETLNFTRAAEQCHVTQPALTRAIKALEDELGGDLMRREGKLSHLTDLGRRMLPLLKQCHDSALSAKAVARSVAAGEARTLALGLSRTVDLRLLGFALSELFRAFPRLRLKLFRGNAGQLVEQLRAGDIDLAVAGPLTGAWDRLDAWPIFSESFEMFVGMNHRLATRNAPDITLSDLLDETFLLQSDSETAEEETRQLAAAGVSMERAHLVDSDSDLAALVEANMGVALAPKSSLRGGAFVRHMTPNIDLRRTVTLYTVQGRTRSPEAGAFISQLRAHAWEEAVA
jgi:DNA-binding transcriptional LysR family regulator